MARVPLDSADREAPEAPEVRGVPVDRTDLADRADPLRVGLMADRMVGRAVLLPAARTDSVGLADLLQADRMGTRHRVALKGSGLRSLG